MIDLALALSSFVGGVALGFLIIMIRKARRR